VFLSASPAGLPAARVRMPRASGVVVGLRSSELSSEVIVPLAIFFALGVPIFLLLWRVFVVGGELRRDAQHGRAAADLARRADVSLTELAELVDDLRRRRAGPEISGPSLRASTDALHRYAQEAAAVDKQTHHTGGVGMENEVERALAGGGADRARPPADAGPTRRAGRGGAKPP